MREKSRFVIGAGVLLGLAPTLGSYVWQWANLPGRTSVPSPDGRFEVAMLSQSLWQRWHRELVIPTLVLTPSYHSTEIHIPDDAESAICCGLAPVSDPVDIWWRQDSQAFIFLTRNGRGRFSDKSYEIKRLPLRAKQVNLASYDGNTLVLNWPMKMIEEKEKSENPLQRTIAHQYIKDFSEARKYLQESQIKGQPAKAPN